MARSLINMRKVMAAFACVALVSGFTGAKAWADHAEDVVAKVNQTLSDDNLTAAAAKTTDPDTVIGLAAFASPARGNEIAARAVSLAPDRTAIAAALAAGWRLDARTVDAFAAADPSNAAPCYLQASLLFGAGKDAEALAPFRKGLACTSFDTHAGEIATGALKALDALGFDDTEKVIALTRLFLPKGFPTYPAWAGSITDLVDTLGKASKETSSESAAIAGDLAKMAEQMLASPDAGRYELLFAVRRALLRSYEIKTSSGTATRTDAFLAGALENYNFLFSNLHFKLLRSLDDSLGYLLQPMPTVESVFGYTPTLSAEDTAKADGVLDAWKKRRAATIGEAPKALPIVAKQVLEGSMAAAQSIEASDKWRSPFSTAQMDEQPYADLTNLPKLFNTPESKSRLNLTLIGMTIGFYQADHNEAFPPDLQTLVTQGILKDKNAVNSPISGKPYVYLGKNLKESAAPAMTVVAYDDAVIRPDKRIVLFADLHVDVKSAAELDQLLRAQGAK